MVVERLDRAVPVYYRFCALIEERQHLKVIDERTEFGTTVNSRSAIITPQSQIAGQKVTQYLLIVRE
jgi:hypothetical protein